MDEMEAVRQVLPVGYEVHTSYDATEYIREELDNDLLPYRFDGYFILACYSYGSLLVS